MKVEVGDINDPLAQLEASKSVIKNLFKDFLKKNEKFKISNNNESFVKEKQIKWRHRDCNYLF